MQLDHCCDIRIMPTHRETGAYRQVIFAWSDDDRYKKRSAVLYQIDIL